MTRVRVIASSMATPATVGFLIGLIIAIGGFGCAREQPSERPPIHLNQNMDDQPRYKPQASSDFYANGAAMRMPVEGTVARGMLREDSVYYFGRTPDGKLVEKNPLPVTMELMKRGEGRFKIYCSPCHGLTGSADGAVVRRGMIKPPSFHEQRLIDTADGHFFDVMTNGVRNMPAYRYQIPVRDRWAIVAYIRALQRSQRATLDEIPVDKRSHLQPTPGATPESQPNAADSAAKKATEKAAGKTTQ